MWIFYTDLCIILSNFVATEVYALLLNPCQESFFLAGRLFSFPCLSPNLRSTSINEGSGWVDEYFQVFKIVKLPLSAGRKTSQSTKNFLLNVGGEIECGGDQTKYRESRQLWSRNSSQPGASGGSGELLATKSRNSLLETQFLSAFIVTLALLLPC